MKSSKSWTGSTSIGVVPSYIQRLPRGRFDRETIHSRTSSHFLSSLQPISCFPSFDTFLLRSFCRKERLAFRYTFFPHSLVFGESLARQCNPSAMWTGEGSETLTLSHITNRPSLNVCCSVTHLTFLSRRNVVHLSSWTVLSFQSLAVNINFIMYIIVIIFTFWWLESLLQAWCQHVSFNCCVNLFHLCNNWLVFK